MAIAIPLQPNPPISDFRLLTTDFRSPVPVQPIRKKWLSPFLYNRIDRFPISEY
ncbi:hypothetical protein [Puniceicoccus vermicola]|uniref:hypothetical protein n=1 Tax=Puniceicoccus vermicola TaxID=388746 RepID=UPI001639769A|nr:hypothetical protein [Puniceicoccus vermicola]